MPKDQGFKPTANPQYAAAMRDIRRSSAAGSHDNRPKRERSRADAKRAAIRRDY